MLCFNTNDYHTFVHYDIQKCIVEKLYNMNNKLSCTCPCNDKVQVMVNLSNLELDHYNLPLFAKKWCLAGFDWAQANIQHLMVQLLWNCRMYSMFRRHILRLTFHFLHWHLKWYMEGIFNHFFDQSVVQKSWLLFKFHRQIVFISFFLIFS